MPGYGEKRARITAIELLKHPEVQLAIHSRQLAALEGSNVDASYVITGIRDTVERCRALGKSFNPNSALKGLELLGKALKLWSDRVELDNLADLAERIREAWKEESSAVLPVIHPNPEQPDRPRCVRGTTTASRCRR